MGSPKALLPWAGTTLVSACVRALAEVGVGQVVVVAGAEIDAVRREVPEAQVVHNPDVAAGRSSSLCLGAAAVTQADAILVQSVDQPCPPGVLGQLFEAVDRGAEVTIPTYGGRRGHPICVAGRLLPELQQVKEEDQGLRAVVRRHASGVREVPVDTELVLHNLNNPAAYAAALAAWGLA
jgi:CTP:molybdopterin cytidylyltransferase MocA